MDDINQLAEQKDIDNFLEAIRLETDPVMLILRAHLYSENLLERFLIANLPRGDKIIENGSNFSYSQKLLLVDSFNTVSDSIITALRNLNRIRNQCAHELDKKISSTDINKLGSSLGKTFTELKRKAEFQDLALLHALIAFICGYLTGQCHSMEHPESNEEKNT